MDVGLFGLPRCGKTTLFQALTGRPAPQTGEAQVAVVDVPDPRFDRLVEVFDPRKIVPATVQVFDLAGIEAGEGKGLSPQTLARIGTADALCCVVRAFDDGSGIDPDPAGDFENLALEMTLSDLQKVENRLEKLTKQIMKLTGAERAAGEKELAALERIRPGLSDGVPIRRLGLTAEEEPVVRGFQFLSQKPALAVVNTGEGTDESAVLAAIAPALEAQGAEAIALNADIESEIAQMDSPEERAAFMEDFGLAESARDRLVAALYDLLGLIKFFTVSEKEVHAWTVPRDISAQGAAGAIHSDLERGFIRAEVIHVDEFHANGSSLSQARQAGKLRAEGKTYPVKDGDIFHVLFNV